MPRAPDLHRAHQRGEPPQTDGQEQPPGRQWVRSPPQVAGEDIINIGGRELALDARLLFPAAADFAGSKINALVENVLSIWQRTIAEGAAADAGQVLEPG